MLNIDGYEWRARVAPAALVLAPLVVVAFAAFGRPTFVSGAVTVVTAAGLVYALTHLVRELGYSKQLRLWAQWGGAPTTSLLRWSGTRNEHAQARRHQAVERATGMSLPSRDDESASPADADQRYEAAVEGLRAVARGENFAYLLKQNANYGFRRNVYGCKTIGIVVALTSGLAAMALAYAAFRGWYLRDRSTQLALATTGSTLWLAMWTLVTPKFVHAAAESYASALLEAADQIERSE